MIIKLKPAIFKNGSLTLSSKYIGTGYWMVLRGDVVDGNASVETLKALLRPGQVVEMDDDKVALAMPADRSVAYVRTSVMVDTQPVATGRLFARADGRNVVAIDEIFVQLLQLETLLAGPVSEPRGSDVRMLQSSLVELSGEEVRALVMPLRMKTPQADALALVARCLVADGGVS